MNRLNTLALLDTVAKLERKLTLALLYAGLRLPQYRAMVFLQNAGKITVGDLSRHLNVSRATTSVLISELTRAGIVNTVSNRSDKRSFYISLTETGLKRLEFAKAEIRLVEEKISRKMDARVVEMLNQFSSYIGY